MTVADLDTWASDYDCAIRVGTRYARRCAFAFDPRDAAGEAVVALRERRLAESYDTSKGPWKKYAAATAAGAIREFVAWSDSAVTAGRGHRTERLHGHRTMSYEQMTDERVPELGETHRGAPSVKDRHARTLTERTTHQCDPEERIDRARWYTRLRSAMERVLGDGSDLYSRAVRAVLLDDEKPADAARATGVPLSVLRSRVNDARARIVCDSELFDMWRSLRAKGG